MHSNVQTGANGRAGPPDPPRHLHPHPAEPKTRLVTASRAVAIVQIESQNAFVLQLRFNDGPVSTVDFAPFLRQARNPQTRQFLKPTRFQAYELRDGNLVWGDYEMCFAIEDLYVGAVDTQVVFNRRKQR